MELEPAHLETTKLETLMNTCKLLCGAPMVGSRHAIAKGCVAGGGLTTISTLNQIGVNVIQTIYIHIKTAAEHWPQTFPIKIPHLSKKN